MTEGYRGNCLCSADHLGNSQLCQLMAEVVKQGKPASGPLLMTVKPLLMAFYEGQVQAGRLGRDEVDDLARQAFNSLYQRRHRYDPNVPFRAWLIEIARSTLLRHLRNQKGTGVGDPMPMASVINLHPALSSI